MAGVLTRSLRESACNAVRGWSRDLLFFFFPPACIICNRPPEDPSPVCRQCEAGLVTLPHPVCPRCSCFITGKALKCPGGHRGVPPLVWSLGLFDTHYRALISAFKFQDRLDCGLFVARRLARMIAADPRSAEIDLVTAVPLHPARGRERGFNQSEYVAAEIGRALDRPVRHDLLRRIRNTKSQTTLSRGDRLHNVAGAFAAPGPAPGLRVLLVDDVLTTGATLRECAGTLQRAGVQSVQAAVVALAETDR